MREAERIARFFAPLAAAEPGSFSLTDDAALLTPPAGKNLIVTTDSAIAGIHLPIDATAEQIARKLVRRNLSDLAAMGASPWRYLLNLHTPTDIDEKWLAAFSAALADEQQHYGMVLVGGDSTSGGGHVHATMTCFGVIAGEPLRRNGAQAGDDVYVSGTIGDAALGLAVLQGKMEVPAAARKYLLERYYRPEPRLALGDALRGIATSAIDISDGLVIDSERLAEASNVGVIIQRDAIPLSAAAQHIVEKNPSAWDTIVNGGDDYELCFTAPVAARATLTALAERLGLLLSRAGSTVPGRDTKLRDARAETRVFGVRDLESD